MTTPTFLIIDPRWHGLGYVDAAFTKGYQLIPIVSSPDHPKKYGYDGKFTDLIIADIEDVNAVIAAIETSRWHKKIDAVLPGNCYFTPLAAQIAEHLGLKGEPYAAALRSRLKDLGREAYDRAGVPNVRYAKIHDLNEALAAAKNIGFPLVLKPTDGGGSEQVTLIHDDAELKTAMTALLAHEKTSFNFKTRQVFIIEEYITGQEFSVELFIQNKEIKFASVTEKLSTPLPYFVEVGHIVPTSVHMDQTQALVSASLRGVLALGFSNGPFHVEIRLSPKGPRIMETNGRVAGDSIATDLLINAWGVNLFHVMMNHLLGLPCDASPKKHQASAIVFLTAKKEGVVTAIDGLDTLRQQPHVVKHHVSVKIGDRVRPAQENADRLGYVITTAPTPQEAKQSALAAIEGIRLMIM